MERLMSDGYPFIFQMIDKSESDEYLIQTCNIGLSQTNPIMPIS